MAFHLHGLRVFPVIGKSGLCRDREIARDKETQRDILNYDGGINDCKHKERACMQTAGCAASRLSNDSCVPAALSTKLRNCTERANARGELGRSLHEPLPRERCANTSRRPKERMHARAQVRGNDQKSQLCWADHTSKRCHFQQALSLPDRRTKTSLFQNDFLHRGKFPTVHGRHAGLREFGVRIHVHTDDGASW
jgi:hypothetical protein